MVSFALWICAAFVVLGRAGFWARASHARLFRWGTWFVAGIAAISALVNLASQSRWENFIWGPLALVLAVLCTIVARSTGVDPQGDAGHRQGDYGAVNAGSARGTATTKEG